MRIIGFVILALVYMSGSAQSKKKDVTPAEAFYPQQEYTPKTAGKKSTKVSYDAREKSSVRQEKNWKDREKREKKFTRNSAVDRSQAPYFGHKRPPKIRPVGKKKLCKVCGLMH